ncbi:hypothetical protein [Nocardioides sp. GXZ039]|uniref:hypothetical protein n=1 Tax=Nocardioides sp. GXZ039 TaxID=3136018 RepID=UPI0030F3DCB7
MSNDRAIRNARQGATECSRRRVERAEVELALARPAGPMPGEERLREAHVR